jgi:hypothetical protein
MVSFVLKQALIENPRKRQKNAGGCFFKQSIREFFDVPGV